MFDENGLCGKVLDVGDGDGDEGDMLDEGVRDADVVLLLRSSDVTISSKSLGILHLMAKDTACTFATVDISILACLESSAGVEPSEDENTGALLYLPLLKPLKEEFIAVDVLSANGPVAAAPAATELLLP
jgi:hypothetical protein